MKRKVMIRSIAVAVCLAAVLAVYILFRTPTAGFVAEASLPLPVATVEAKDVVTARTFPVAIEGEMDVEIRPQVEGYLAATNVKEGDFVTRGTVLFEIDDALYREEFHAAAANLSVSEANLEKAAIELERSRELLANHVISDIQFRTVQADYKQAQATMRQNKAACQGARVRLDYTRLKAPVSGLVGRLPYRKGSYVSTANAEPLTLLSAVDRVRACFSISERDYLPFVEERKKNNRKISLLLADGTTYPHAGTISAVNGSFDRNTGAMAVWVEFTNPDHLLRSGNTGSVRVDKPMKGALLVPQKATFRRQDKTLVYRLEADNSVKSCVIVPAGEADGHIVVADGLRAGDRILLSGLNKVTDGTIIQPVGK